MISVSNLTKRYGNLVAVNNITFNIPRGQIVGLLGHNGAGKTTTLKMLTGFLEPDNGEILIDGLDMHENREKVQEKIGYLAENAPLYPDMTVIEYLDFTARLRNIPENQISKLVRESISKTRLELKAFEKIDTLSKGYRQRVGVAQAILTLPPILILDEPTNGLDPSQILEMRSLIKELSKHSAIIISTHILQEVEAICDRAIIISQGKMATDTLLSVLKENSQVVLTVNQDAKEVLPFLRNIKEIKEARLSARSESHYIYKFKIEGDKNRIIPAMAKIAVQKGWELFGLDYEAKNLESIFREMNGEKGA